MSKCVNCCGPALRVGLIASTMILGANAGAGATEECLTAPNRAPGPGGHWYFHFDRNQDRKCWYLTAPAPQPAAEEAPASPLAPTVTTAPAPNPPPSFGSIFSSWTAGFSSAPAAPPPDTANATAPARPDDAAAPRQPRAVHRSDSQQAALTPKPRRPPPARAPVAHADDGGTASLTEAERDALFQEFLRWRGRQSEQ
jgi:hypothetical protein